MENNKKLLWEAIFFILVFWGTVYGVFQGKDFSQTIQIIKDVKVLYLLPAVLCVLLFIWGESIIIHYLLGSLNIKMRKWICFLFSSIGFFFSCITPSASGGQPVQVYYMKRKGIPIPVATMVLMVVTITYKAVLVLIGLGMIVFGQEFIHEYLSDILPIFYLGIVLNVCCVGFMILLVFHTTLAKNILSKGLNFLEKIHLVHYKESRHKKLESGMTKYQEAAAYFREHQLVVVNVLVITFIQRIAIFMSTYFVYLAFDLSGFSVIVIVLLQAVISISVDMLPLPGGMGISEKLFLTIFAPVFGAKILFPGMILSRGLSYYTELILCAIFTLVAHYVIEKKRPI